ncbi:MAG: helix-turn-helix transcriptional regulator [Acidobacteria bacterium]|nr:helix-turn-helix transcriptional regulator [Acidobacteriota bacterium]
MRISQAGVLRMDPLNKKEIGKRIKRLRKEKGLKQWQMADMLGATQPAIHKYENGILPEVKRLLELARVGNTSMEWILTGRHWEQGSEDRERIPAELFQLAARVHQFTREQRQILISAMELLENAGERVRERTSRNPADLDVQEIARTLRDFDSLTRKALAAALAVHDAVVETLAESKVRDFDRLTASTSSEPSEPEGGEDQGRPPLKVQKEIS